MGRFLSKGMGDSEMSEGTPTNDVHPNPSARWTNRRRMAWAALVAGIIYPVVVLSAGDRGMGLTDMAFPFYMFVAGVVGAYVGFATLDDRWRQDSYGGGYKRW